MSTAQQRQCLSWCSLTAPGEGGRTGLVAVGCCTDSLKQGEVQKPTKETSQEEQKDTKTRLEIKLQHCGSRYRQQIGLQTGQKRSVPLNIPLVENESPVHPALRTFSQRPNNSLCSTIQTVPSRTAMQSAYLLHSTQAQAQFHSLRLVFWSELFSHPSLKPSCTIQTMRYDTAFLTDVV